MILLPPTARKLLLFALISENALSTFPADALQNDAIARIRLMGIEPRISPWQCFATLRPSMRPCTSGGSTMGTGTFGGQLARKLPTLNSPTISLALVEMMTMQSSPIVADCQIVMATELVMTF